MFYDLVRRNVRNSISDDDLVENEANPFSQSALSRAFFMQTGSGQC